MIIRNSIHHPAGGLFFWFCYAFVCAWLALAITWWFFAQQNYAYDHWYQQLAIEEHLQRYASQNVRRPGFQQLPPEQHKAAFAQISRAVHSRGEGLEDIRYTLPSGLSLPLLVEEEVVHLQDVADLFVIGLRLSVLMLLVWPILAWLLLRVEVPAWRWRVMSAAAPLLLVVVWLLIAGPTQVFYTLHEWLFPPENPWFFYWEESLMSALMKAPVLFGAIAIVLTLGMLLLTPFFYLVGIVVLGRLANYGVARQ